MENNMRLEISAFTTNVFFTILDRLQYNTSFGTYDTNVRSAVRSDIIIIYLLFI
jgi:hypothetical protein